MYSAVQFSSVPRHSRVLFTFDWWWRVCRGMEEQRRTSGRRRERQLLSRAGRASFGSSPLARVLCRSQARRSACPWLVAKQRAATAVRAKTAARVEPVERSSTSFRQRASILSVLPSSSFRFISSLSRPPRRPWSLSRRTWRERRRFGAFRLRHAWGPFCALRKASVLRLRAPPGSRRERELGVCGWMLAVALCRPWAFVCWLRRECCWRGLMSCLKRRKFVWV